MVQRGLEPRTLELLAPRSNQLSYKTYTFGEVENRTPDLMHAKHALYQLSYIPKFIRNLPGSN